MPVLYFFIGHWYLSIFAQTFFHHRYAAHSTFSMSKFWEKFFHLFSFIAQGSSYLSPYTYGVMHRMHHAFADTKKDPHSPLNDGNPISMMLKTRKIYNAIDRGKVIIDEKFLKGVPKWKSFELFASNNYIRVLWIAFYLLVYQLFDAHWALYFLIPIHILMGPFHGVIINWYAHRFGYRNYEVADTSKNLIPVDVLMMGEGLHNNHHKFGGRANFGTKWFEFDPTYYIILLLNKLKVIKLKKRNPTEFM